MERDKLLQIKEVVEEINRHKWLRSMMLGYDIGFATAANDWIEKYSAHWVRHHMKAKK